MASAERLSTSAGTRDGKAGDRDDATLYAQGIRSIAEFVEARMRRHPAAPQQSSVSEKCVKVHEFTSPTFTGPDENILCAVIIGPDRDDPTGKTLHLRANAAAIEMMRTLPRKSVEMILEHQERLLAEFRKLVCP
jgi:hypothetical protein